MRRNYTSEEILVDKLLIDDTESFEELHHRYCIPLYIYCTGKLSSDEEAKRIIREIFVALWENRHTLPVGFSISSHLYTEVRRKVIESINKNLDDNDNIPVIEKKVMPGFNAMHLRKAKQPITKIYKDRMNIQTAMIHTKEQTSNGINHYMNTVILKNVRYAVQKVTHLW